MKTFSILFALILIAPSLAVAAVSVSNQVGQTTPERLTLVWTLDLAPGWHLYGPHRNDTGLPPQVEFPDLPDGWRADPLEGWPTPHRHVVADLILDHVYEERLVLSQTIHHPRGTAATAITAHVSWLVCGEICVPGDTTLTLQLPTSATEAGAARLAQVQAQRPRPLPSDLVTWSWSGSRLTIAVPGASDLLFIPTMEGPAISNLLEGGQSRTSPLTLWTEDATYSRKSISGILLLTYNNKEQVGSITIPPPNPTGGTP